MANELRLKSSEYYSHARYDIIDIVISTGSIEKILDVGCGYGYTGESLKERGAATVEGLELVQHRSLFLETVDVALPLHLC